MLSERDHPPNKTAAMTAPTMEPKNKNKAKRLVGDEDSLHWVNRINTNAMTAPHAPNVASIF